MVDKDKVIRIAVSKHNIPVTYDHFYKLRPKGKAGGHYLREIKRILISSGYVCHQRGQKQRWGHCGYEVPRTHFHRPKQP